MLTDLEKKAMEAVNRENLMATVNEIAKFERLSGSKDELEAFKLIEKKMQGYGFKTSLVLHDAYISLPVSASMRVVSPETVDMFCITHSSSVSTPEGGIGGEVVWIGDPRHADQQKVCVKGKFVVFEGLASPDPTAWANEHGALGQIHVSYDEHIHDMTIQNVWGNPDDKNVATLPKTHVVSISRADGDKLKALLAKGAVKVHVETKVETKWTKIPQLECSIEGNDGTGDFLLFSGHVDSWYYGAMDNGSANATMMEVGRILASMKGELRRGLKICFWSGHSHGRYAGSAHYCDNHWEELFQHCIMHLNTDSTGGVGANDLKRASIMAETRNIGAWAIGETMGIPFEGSRIGRNGDQSFWGVGIPSMFVSIAQQPTGGLGWWWHNPADLPDKVDPDNLVRDTKVYALVASRLVGSDVLPFDYSATVDEWLQVVAKVQEKAGDKFDLSAVAARAKELKSLITELQAKKSACNCCVNVINECLLKLGRALVSVSFTEAGKFSQDPAFNVPALPDLYDAVRLADLPCDSDAAKFLKVRLVRGRNRVLAALAEAKAAVTCALEQLK